MTQFRQPKVQRAMDAPEMSESRSSAAVPAAAAVPDARRPRESGVVLVSVLWIAILIGLVGGAMALLSNTDARRAEATIRRLQAEALADGAFNLVSLELTRNAPLVADALATGEPFELTLPGGRALVRIEDESFKPDLNTADVIELGALFQSVGVDPDEAERLAAAVIDFRDPDDLVQLDGAEARQYRAAGLDYEPRNGQFLHISEVRWVLGVTPEIAARIAEVATARPAPGAPSLQDDSVTLADSAPDTATQALLLAPGATDRVLFRMTIETETESGARSRLVAVIAPSFNETALFEVEEWRRP